jgi:hypothetical protein
VHHSEFDRTNSRARLEKIGHWVRFSVRIGRKTTMSAPLPAATSQPAEGKADSTGKTPCPSSLNAWSASNSACQPAPRGRPPEEASASPYPCCPDAKIFAIDQGLLTAGSFIHDLPHSKPV